MDIEHRTLARELRAADPVADGSIGVLAGYAAVFNSRSENLGGFFEEILPGAFDAVLDNDVRALIDHDSGRVLGRSVAGTLRISTDAVGLRYEVDLPDTQEARDLLVLVKRGDVRESSFGFTIARRGDEWAENEDGQIIRSIVKVQRLYDVSPVAFPAYPAASVAMRGLIQRARETDKHTAPIVLLQSQISAIGERLERAERGIENNGLRISALHTRR